MGGLARVALPVAASFAAPYAGAALGLNSAAAAAGTKAALGAFAKGAFISDAVAASAAAQSSTIFGQALTGSLFSGINQVGSLRQQRAQQRSARARTQAEAARIQREFEIRERNRRDALRKAVATQRARFGGRGINSSGGSAAAIIGGLQRKSTEDSRFDLEGVNLRRSNLLEASRPIARNNFRLFQKTLSPLVNLLD